MVENALKITVLHLFNKLLLNIAQKWWWIWIGHTKI